MVQLLWNITLNQKSEMEYIMNDLPIHLGNYGTQIYAEGRVIGKKTVASV